MMESNGDKIVKSVHWNGRRQSTLRRSKNSQDFYTIRKKCLDSGELFKDPEFPANDSSLFYSHPVDRYYEWLRPHEICNDPQFFVKGFSRFDVQQGSLSDCWFLAAVANLTQDKKLFHQVVYEDNSFENNYAGIFHFRFWQFGNWIEVVIDDRLPTYCGRLVFMRSSEKNEFWSALLEKAYAKAHGSYEHLNGGTTSEAFQDFTGGITEMYHLDKAPSSLYKVMIKAHENYSMMSCCIQADPQIPEAVTAKGLIKGHAYSITKVQYVDVKTPNVSGKIPLVRLRNPWGDQTEWTGAWSDKSPQWTCVPENVKEEISLIIENDGEFWMSFEDFLKNFDRLEICNLTPEFLSANGVKQRKKWKVNFIDGEWAQSSAGGCRMYIDTFWKNPQYIVTLTAPDDDDEENEKCTVVVALMQKNRRSRKNIGLDLLSIGFTIYKVTDKDLMQKPLEKEFFETHASYASIPAFINMREVSARFKFPVGSYVIIPSTFKPGDESEFLIRVFSENKNFLEENEKDVGMHEEKLDVIEQFNAEMLFKEVTAIEKEIGWMELKKIIDKLVYDVFPHGFSKDICRSMVAMLDIDHSGKLGFEEFTVLFNNINKWKNIFKQYDKDHTNSLDANELRAALLSAGYYPNNRILNSMIYRYASQNGTLDFDDFILCAIKMKTLIDLFKSKDINNQRQVLFTIDEWIARCLYT